MSGQASEQELEPLAHALFPRASLERPLRWLVVAAHPDDEVLGASWVLARARELTVLHVTDGAPHERRLWPPGAPETREGYAQLRQEEASTALSIAGVEPGRMWCLGLVDQEASFTLLPLAWRLRSLFEELHPHLVLVHPYEGGHPDHDASAFASHAAAALLLRAGLTAPSLVEMTSYHRWEGHLRCLAFLPCPSSAPVAERDLGEEGRVLKRSMLGCFASQAQVLEPFPVDRECFRAAPCYDFTQPPHPGVLHYESLGWPLTGARWRVLAKQALDELGLGGVPCL